MHLKRLLILAFALLPLGVQAQDISSADSAAVFAALERWEEAWRINDAAMASVDYSANADWTNAFGMRRIGQAAIQAKSEAIEAEFSRRLAAALGA